MKPVARFVIRGDSDGVNPIIGKTFNDTLKPDHIYQIEEVLGELIIKDLGFSFITNDPSIYNENEYLKYWYSVFPHWGYDFNWIFSHCKEFILTLEEAIHFAKENYNKKNGE